MKMSNPLITSPGNPSIAPRNGRPILESVFETSIPILLRAITPIHPGSGAQVSALVDLPIQRESHTDIPFISGTSLKGSLRSWFTSKGIPEHMINRIFGPPPGRGDEGMGEAVFLDARLLLIPVRSLRGVYGWVTSPLLISRFLDHLRVVRELTGGAENSLTDHQAGKTWDGTPQVHDSCTLSFKMDSGEWVLLEDVAIPVKKVKEQSLLKTLLDRLPEDLGGRIASRLVVVDDNTLMTLLKRAVTVNAHIAIDPRTGTAANLWFQEDLPPETILYSAVLTSRDCAYECELGDGVRGIKSLLGGIIHIGGDMTTGLGFAEVYWLDG